MEYWKNPLEKVFESLLPEERKRCAIYVREGLVEAGEEFQAGRATQRASRAGHLVFIDLEPGVNWGHDCRYLLVAPNGEIIHRLDGQFPPSPEGLRLVYRADAVEDWMLLTTQSLE